MSRPRLIGGIAVILILIALAGVYLFPPSGEQRAVEPAEQSAATAPAPQSAASSPAGSSAGTASERTMSEGTAQKPDYGTAPQTAQQSPQAPATPKFDILRVAPSGESVLAGTAAPNASVEVIVNGEEAATVTADKNGNWTWVPQQPLAAGDNVITLKSDAGESDQAMVVKVPEKGRDLAGKPVSEPVSPMAVAVPREAAPTRRSNIIQAPARAPTTQAASQVAKAANAAAPAAPAADKVDDGGTNAAAVSIGTVDYDDQGQVVFAGTGQPGSEVQVYLDNKIVGRATVDAQGNWQLTPRQKIASGPHTVRVDAITGDNRLVARIEFPFMRAGPMTNLPAGALVVIQPGNNLWRIASRVYGSGTRYTEIFAANRDQIKDPNLIYPGQIFGLPTVN